MSNKKGASRATRELRLHVPSRKLEVRSNSDGTYSIGGVAVPYNSLSEDLGFREVIKPGAFTACLKGKPDLLLLYSHDDSKVCARVSNSSLQIEDTPTALRFTAKLPNVSWTNDIVNLLKADLMGGMSFGFSVLEDAWQDTGEYLLRSVTKADIFEISVVPSWPAYTQTSVDIRQVPRAFRSKLKRSIRSATKTKEVDGAHLGAHCFAYVGDPTKTDTWKLPIYFPGDKEKTKSHIKDALARFNQTEGIPDSEKNHVFSHITGAAKSNGIQVTAEKLEDRDFDDDDGFLDGDGEDYTDTDNDDDGELSTLRLRLRLAQHRAKKF